jgi:hypothetical protein
MLLAGIGLPEFAAPSKQAGKLPGEPRPPLTLQLYQRPRATLGFASIIDKLV